MNFAFARSAYRAMRSTQTAAAWRSAAIALFAVLCASFATAAILPEPQRVSGHAWAWIGPYEGPAKSNNGFRMNLGFVVGTEAIAVIDTGYTREMAEEMVMAIARISKLPIRYAINTNSQPHRFMGNDVFRKAGARVISSVEAAARMSKDGGDFARTIASVLELKVAPTLPAVPDQLIEEKGSARFDLGGGVTLEVMHFGRAHTGGSLVVRVTPDRVVFAGDVLYASRLLAVLPDSSVSGWIKAYERLATIDAKLFVPGHGQIGALNAFDQPTLAYLRALKAHMDQAVKDGSDPSTAVRAFDASRWKHLVNFEELATRNAALTFLESEREGF